MLRGRVDDETEAVRGVTREDALDFVAWDVFRISLDVNTGLGRVRGVNGKTMGPVERPTASRKSSVMDQSIRGFINRHSGVAIRADLGSGATISCHLPQHTQTGRSRVAL